MPAVASRMPRMLHADMSARVLALEDLGDAQPLTSLYSGAVLSADDLEQLGGYLARFTKRPPLQPTPLQPRLAQPTMAQPIGAQPRRAQPMGAQPRRAQPMGASRTGQCGD